MDRSGECVRLAAVSFPLTAPGDYAAWTLEAKKWLNEAHAQNAELVVFPEYMSLSLENDAGFKSWFAGEFQNLFQSEARRTGMIILAGTHNIGTNTAALFKPSGEIILQHKIHLIPSEPDIKAGEELAVVNFSQGKLTTTICYDVEFPELTRAAVKAGINLLLCPSWTEKDDGFHRVRTCALARAIENQLFVVHAPLVGSLKPWGIDESAVGSAAILAPCDPAFPANGILAEGPWSQGAVVMADVDFELLKKVRLEGAVRTYRDFMNPPPFKIKSI